jgi:hypothetical protein
VGNLKSYIEELSCEAVTEILSRFPSLHRARWDVTTCTTCPQRAHNWATRMRYTSSNIIPIRPILLRPAARLQEREFPKWFLPLRFYDNSVRCASRDSHARALCGANVAKEHGNC